MKTILLCAGITHHTASLDVRQCLSQPTETLANFLSEFHHNPLQELAVLSTCNRLELYACATFDPAEGDGDVYAPLRVALAAFSGLPVKTLEPYLFYRRGAEVTQHLFNVASGLDSLVVGETQILGQVSAAHEMALAAGSGRAVLSALFRAAIHTGKRVQTETSLSHASPNLSAAAVRRASEMIDDFTACNVLVVGAGKMARLALESLSKAGAHHVTVTNRTFATAQELSARWNYTAARFNRLPDLVAGAAAVFTLTSARQPVLSGEMIARAVACRPERPLLLVDLGVPGNVDPAARKLAGVHLANLDDLQASFSGAAAGQSEALAKDQGKAIAAAQAIVQDEARGFESWLAIMPVISELHKKAEAIRQREVARTLRHLPDADPQLYELFQMFSQSLVDKLLHDPTMRLRKGRGQSVKQYSHALEVLFDLPTDSQTTDKERSKDL